MLIVAQKPLIAATETKQHSNMAVTQAPCTVTFFIKNR